MLVLAGQVTLDESALRAAGIAAAHSITDFAGSVQIAIDDAARQLTGSPSRRPHGGAPARVGNSGPARYR